MVIRGVGMSCAHPDDEAGITSWTVLLPSCCAFAFSRRDKQLPSALHLTWNIGLQLPLRDVGSTSFGFSSPTLGLSMRRKSGGPNDILDAQVFLGPPCTLPKLVKEVLVHKMPGKGDGKITGHNP